MFYKKLTIANMKTALLFMAFAFMLTACGGGEGNSDGIPPTASGISGCAALDPAPGNAISIDFCQEFWQKDNMQNVCASCHVETFAPFFMAGKESGDINVAASSLLTTTPTSGGKLLVDLANPSQSYIIDKVLGGAAEGDGHNCWASDQACADIILGYIENWAGSNLSGREIQLSPPTNATPPGGGKEFPATATTVADEIPPIDSGTTFEQLIYTPILREYCIACHDTGGIGSPSFSVSNVETSYQLSQSRINLDSPPDSRFVRKIITEDHGCWSFVPAEFPDVTPTGDDCTDSAAAMEDAITKFAAGIPTNAVDTTEFLISRATTIPDGIVAAGGSRYEAEQIALYEFKAGQGTTAYDTSGAGTALNLILDGPVSWVGGWGISIDGSGAMARSGAAEKLYNMIQTSGEYSIETWVAPGNVTQEMARIINYTGGSNKNFALSQTLYNYESQVRNSNTSLTGEPALATPDAEEVLQATLQHVVTTYDALNGRQIYVNGVLRASGDVVAQGGSIANWDPGYTLVLGNESGATNDNNLWKGVLKMVSIHNGALTPTQIQQNYDAGVGEKFFLLFDISHISGVPSQSYIKFTVSQFDSYSYLFTDPEYVSLDNSIVNVNIPIKGMRIGINSNPAVSGQAYVNIDTTITTNGQALSNIGTTIELEKGPNLPAPDEFYLIFERLGTESRTYAQPAVAPRAPADLPEASDIGLKTFDEINATFSSMLGISTQTGNIPSTYDLVKQQLPADENASTFVTAHNIGITQLAMAYCEELVSAEVASPGSTLLTGVNLNQTATNAEANASTFIDPILAAVNGTGMDYQMDDGTFATGGTVPDAAGDTYTTKSELIHLVGQVNRCIGGSTNPPIPACGDDAAQTRELVKAVCTAAMSSANSIIQ